MNPLTHWKTSSLGLLAILGAVAHAIHVKQLNTEDIATIVTGIGLLFSADSNKIVTQANYKADKENK